MKKREYFCYLLLTRFLLNRKKTNPETARSSSCNDAAIRLQWKIFGVQWKKKSFRAEERNQRESILRVRSKWKEQCWPGRRRWTSSFLTKTTRSQYCWNRLVWCCRRHIAINLHKSGALCRLDCRTYLARFSRIDFNRRSDFNGNKNRWRKFVDGKCSSKFWTLLAKIGKNFNWLDAFLAQICSK